MLNAECCSVVGLFGQDGRRVKLARLERRETGRQLSIQCGRAPGPSTPGQGPATAGGLYAFPTPTRIFGFRPLPGFHLFHFGCILASPPPTAIMPKAPKSPGVRDQRHNPLAEEYAPSDPWKQKPAKRQKRNKDDDTQDELGYVDSKSSRKILDIGRELEEEDERESRANHPTAANPAFDFESRMGEDDAEDVQVDHFDDDDEGWGDDDDNQVEEVEIDANDLAAWNKFIPTDENPIVWPGQEAQASGPGTDLAALILEKIAAHEATGGQAQQPEIMGGGDPEDAVELPAKVVEGTHFPCPTTMSMPTNMMQFTPKLV